MPNLHRYTGAFPPVDVLAQYPNWEPALDEEGDDDQDETTIRPAEEQTYVAEFIPFTAADAWLASGEHRVAIVEVFSSGIRCLNVFDSADWWQLRYDEREERWQPFTPAWMPEAERPPTVALSDPAIFPLRFATRLPFEPGGQPVRIEIDSSGHEREWHANNV